MWIRDFMRLAAMMKNRGQGGKAMGNIINFQDLQSEAGLVDIDFTGQEFTWCNNKDGRVRVKERLDRYLISPDWVSQWLSTQLFQNLQ